MCSCVARKQEEWVVDDTTEKVIVECGWSYVHSNNEKNHYGVQMECYEEYEVRNWSQK